MTDTALLDKFKIALKKEGLKNTPQRVAVLEEIIKDEGHRESEEIYLALKNQGRHVSRATVYRTMDILVSNGFARKLNLGDGRARYESKVNSPHHDHLVCIDCGLIIEFMDQEIEDIQEEIADQHDFVLKRHIHQLFGLCKTCQK
ncbi:MAG: Fur family transcriptional regulator [Candidatus Marinimicrobia bacterium]|jgi:Fur family ferric uptake transcriptional regulator|nr:Fur family transcriptional regulator [Candidatus Neomarinimicrobiota bacterium]MDP6852853.1 Fur family transcriptional regulator [Candidatus Neomarinimicrobiota bacterium]MDP6936122.1 Fur family transcriptional regulator [Candidatus Neomarinimicrobiota bacterium]